MLGRIGTVVEIPVLSRLDELENPRRDLLHFRGMLVGMPLLNEIFVYNTLRCGILAMGHAESTHHFDFLDT